jgi:hypothetical protein
VIQVEDEERVSVIPDNERDFSQTRVSRGREQRVLRIFVIDCFVSKKKLTEI